jgi:hypothetical protein
MNNKLNPMEEHCLDALLTEALADQPPPDLSRKILRRLAEDSGAMHPASRARDSKPSTPLIEESETQRQRQLLVIVSLVATLAASLMVAVWLRAGRSADLSDGLAGSQETVPAIDPLPESPQVVPPRMAGDEAAPRRPSRGIPLAVRDDRADDPTDPLFSTPKITADPGIKQPVAAVTLVSGKVHAEMKQYWDAVGITPSPAASPETIANRLARVLGVEIPSAVIGDPQQLKDAFADRAFSQAVAAQWLNQISDGGLKRIDADQQSSLVNEMAQSLQGAAEFDLTLTRWLDGQSDSASAFYNALAAGRADANDDAAMIRRLASVTMNVDLRCTRCHDSYIEGRGRQHDYWTFTALIQRGVRRADGKLQIDPNDEKQPNPVFYESSDGRQRLAEPEVAQAWLGRNDLPRVQHVGDWAKTLVGSESLARGIVNSLWQLVHGQPLRGRVVDPISAPRNDALDRLEAELVQDLIRSRFDVARTLALVIASPVTSREVPEVLLPENTLVANEPDTLRAMNAVNAFAAALPVRVSLPLQERVAQVLRSVGASLDADGQPFVAQIGESGGGNSKTPAVDNLAPDFPHRAQAVPVQWLRRIDDPDSQVAHLAYLAGLSRVPKSVAQAAEVTREIEDNYTALHRVWWLVKP